MVHPEFKRIRTLTHNPTFKLDIQFIDIKMLASQALFYYLQPRMCLCETQKRYSRLLHLSTFNCTQWLTTKESWTFVTVALEFIIKQGMFCTKKSILVAALTLNTQQNLNDKSTKVQLRTSYSRWINEDVLI